MPTQKQNLVTFALDLVKARTNDQPLLDPLFNTLDKVIRGVFSPTSKPSDSDIRLAVVNLYARILPFTSGPGTNPISLKTNAIGTWITLREDPRFDTSKTSVSLSKLTNKIVKSMKPPAIGLDAFLIELLIQTFGNDNFQAALNAILQSTNPDDLTPTTLQLPL